MDGSRNGCAVFGLVLKGAWFNPWLSLGLLLDIVVLVAVAHGWPVECR